MSGVAVVHIGENSPEQVAYKLMQDIAKVESRRLDASVEDNGTQVADRKWILDVFAECILTVRDPMSRLR